MRIKGLAFLAGTVAAGMLLPGCLTGPLHSPNPLGHPNPHRDLATQAQYPLRSAPDKEEVDRRFEETYPGTINWLWVWGRDRWFDLLGVFEPPLEIPQEGLELDLGLFDRRGREAAREPLVAAVDRSHEPPDSSIELR